MVVVGNVTYKIVQDRRSLNVNNDFDEIEKSTNRKPFCVDDILDIYDWNVELILCNEKENIKNLHDEKLKIIMNFVNDVKRKYNVADSIPLLNLSEMQLRNRFDIVAKMLNNFIIFIFSKKQYVRTGVDQQVLSKEKIIEGVAICYQYKKMLYVSDFFTQTNSNRSKILSFFPEMILSKMPFLKYIVFCIVKEMYPLYRRQHYKIYKKPKIETKKKSIGGAFKQQQQQQNKRRPTLGGGGGTTLSSPTETVAIKENNLAMYFHDLSRLSHLFIIHPKLVSDRLCVEDDETNQEIDKISMSNCKKIKRRYATCNYDDGICDCIFVYLKIEKRTK